MKKIPRHYFKFRPEFVADVVTGKKACTIRGTRKRVPKVGEIAVLETWSGRPYNSDVIALGERPLTAVRPIDIVEPMSDVAKHYFPLGVIVTIDDDRDLSDTDVEALALADGFPDVQAFIDFFRDRLPFSGHLFEWRTNPQKTT